MPVGAFGLSGGGFAEGWFLLGLALRGSAGSPRLGLLPLNFGTVGLEEVGFAIAVAFFTTEEAGWSVTAGAFIGVFLVFFS